MDAKDLDARSGELGKRSAESEGVVMGLRLDVLKAIIADIEGSKDLAEALGPKAARKLMVVPTLNDLQIVDIEQETLDREKRKKMVAELKRIKARHVPYI